MSCSPGQAVLPQAQHPVGPARPVCGHPKTVQLGGPDQGPGAAAAAKPPLPHAGPTESPRDQVTPLTPRAVVLKFTEKNNTQKLFYHCFLLLLSPGHREEWAWLQSHVYTAHSGSARSPPSGEEESSGVEEFVRSLRAAVTHLLTKLNIPLYRVKPDQNIHLKMTFLKASHCLATAFISSKHAKISQVDVCMHVEGVLCDR